VADAVEKKSKQGPEDSTREMTPEEIQDAFRRYDFIIGLFTVLMAFFAASFVARSPDLWLRAASGERILSSPLSFPRVSDFAYTSPESVGVEPAWLYNVVSAALLRTGDVALVASKVVAIVVSVLLLLSVRHAGASFHWPIACVGLMIVGMSGRLDVGPTIASYLMLALLLWIGHGATSLGRERLLLWAIPVLITWANVDIAFPLGSAVFLSFLLGDGLAGWTSSRSSVEQGTKRGWVSLGLGVVAALFAGCVSPFGISNWLFPWQMIPVYRSLPPLHYAWDGWGSIISAMQRGDWTPDLVAWWILVMLAGGVILIGFQRLSVTRILLFVIALALVTCERWIGLSSMLLAFVASQGGQDFAARHLRSGVATSGWGLVRAQLVVVVLLIGVFIGMIAALTGRMQGRVAEFGFGIDRIEFAGQTADWLKGSGLTGKLLSISSGGKIESYFAYAAPESRAFVDLRWPTAGDAFSLLQRTQVSLVGLDQTKANDWKEIFKKFGVTHVVVDVRDESDIMRTVRQSLSRRSDLAPISIDDQTIVYGWLSDENPDYQRVKEQRVQANALAFRSKRLPPPPTDRTVTAPGLIDTVWPIRMTVRPPGLFKGTVYSIGGRWLSQPGAGVLATSYLREAVSANPDNPDAHLRLGLAYLTIIQNELSQLPANFQAAETPNGGETQAAAPTGKQPARLIPSDVILTRYHQAMAALQSALLAGADRWKKETALGVHTALAMACQQNRLIDLWLKHLREQRAYVTHPDQRALIDADIAAVEKEVKQRLELYQQQVDRLSAERRDQANKLDGEIASRTEAIKTASETDRRQLEGEIEMIRRQASLLRADAERDRPIENAQVAFALDLPAKAVEEIEKVPTTSPEADASANFIIRVYLRLGLPDKAEERLRLMRGAGRLGPGIYSWLLAQTQLTRGQYDAARMSLEQAIAEVTATQLRDSIDKGFAKILQGRMVAPDGAIPFNEAVGIVSSGSLEASFYYDLAIVHLELAEPNKMMDDFRKIIDVAPAFKLMPIIDYYAREIDDKPLEKPAIPTIDEEIVERFADPPAESAPVSPNASSPPPAETESEPAAPPAEEKK
jgi:tetratricopeptide (TPR) repeat protein